MQFETLLSPALLRALRSSVGDTVTAHGCPASEQNLSLPKVRALRLWAPPSPFPFHQLQRLCYFFLFLYIVLLLFLNNNNAFTFHYYYF